MSRITLLLLQALVAVVSVALWYALTTYPIFGKILLPPFFFSNPVDVGAQIVAWFVSGVIWKHLWVTLVESILAFVIGSIGSAACWSASGLLANREQPPCSIHTSRWSMRFRAWCWHRYSHFGLALVSGRK